MAQKICTVLHSIEWPIAASCPLSYSLEVSHHRTQRIILYDPQFLVRNTTISFVGFVSEKQKAVDPYVDSELQRAEGLLATELVSMSGLLCNSFLEFRTGNWYNLVLLADPDVKTHFKNGSTHRYLAYQLAPRYYNWIRLHNGIMPDGLSSNTLLLQKTKYYTPHATEQHFTIHQLTY